MPEVVSQHRKNLRMLYEEHFEYVLRSLMRLGATSAEIDDLAQECFLVLSRKLPELDQSRSLRPFLFGVARNLVRDAHRRQFVPVSDSLPHLGNPDSDGALLVHSVLRKMPEDLRAALILVEMEGQTLAEAGKILGISEDTARSWTRRAREEFRRLVEEYD